MTSKPQREPRSDLQNIAAKTAGNAALASSQHSELVAKAEEIVGAIRSYSDFNGIEAADVIEGLVEQFDAAQRENHEWNAAYGRLLQLLYRADGQLELENEKHPNHNITELRRDIAAEAKKNA